MMLQILVKYIAYRITLLLNIPLHIHWLYQLDA